MSVMVYGILGVGVDIEGIARFRSPELSADKVLLNNIFTSRELDYCQSYTDPAPHLAARFAAKEAIVKALSAAGFTVSELSGIEILINKSGIPQAIIDKQSVNGIQVHISLSHNQQNAIAFAIVTKQA